jgi:hypothetical protein
MRKLLLNTEDLRVESFTTTDMEKARRGTVHAQGGALSNAGLVSCGIDGCLNSNAVSVCVCDTTHTQRPPECDPSEQTLCVEDTLCFCE